MGVVRRKPEWLRVRRLAVGERASTILGALAEHRLHTVCSSALCPNKGACFAEGTATYMILGDVCTRACRFCDVKSGRPGPIDSEEPRRLAEAAAKMGLKYVVVTSVCRDDLPDEGALHFARTIEALRSRIEGVQVEVLTPDFSGRDGCLRTVLEARPDVFNHNLETVERLTPVVRSKAQYRRSLGVLEMAKRLGPGIPSKSGLMAGLGETREEMRRTFADLAGIGVERLTIGQYLQPSRRHIPADRFLEPAEFSEMADEAKAAGIPAVLSGPLVRSSYHAASFGQSHSDLRR
jgi:lipoic acid synthetase